ncbi:MAG: hypothetical protein ACRBBS_00660 [Thalassovita sp.]
MDQVDAGIRFIAVHPLACAIYTELDGKAFRKWGLKSFPVSVFSALIQTAPFGWKRCMPTA